MNEESLVLDPIYLMSTREVIQAECDKHGRTNFAVNYNHSAYCCKCHAEQMRELCKDIHLHVASHRDLAAKRRFETPVEELVFPLPGEDGKVFRQDFLRAIQVRAFQRKSWAQFEFVRVERKRP